MEGRSAFSQSDVQGRPKLAASLAVATMCNRSPFTAFSSAGGPPASRYEPGTTGQYSVRQWLEEAALHYRGFSFQHEFHWKRIRHDTTGIETSLRGSYVQAGMFAYRPEPEKPNGLEVAARWGFVDPHTSTPRDCQQELTGALNWFFRGHANKVTLDVSRITLSAPTLRTSRAAASGCSGTCTSESRLAVSFLRQQRLPGLCELGELALPTSG